LPVSNGGTGAATLTANSVLIGNGTSAVTAVAPSTNGNVLTSNGTAWTSAAPAAGGVTSIVAGTGISVSGTTAVTVNVVNTLGAVGTYGFCLGADANPGSSYAASTLYWGALQQSGCCLALIKYNVGRPSAGTWKAMGGSVNGANMTLFVRIA
jgi:hypothetical protein